LGPIVIIHPLNAVQDSEAIFDVVAAVNFAVDNARFIRSHAWITTKVKQAS